MKKKIKPTEVTDMLQRVKWAAFFRNSENIEALKRAMSEEFDEDNLRNILGDIVADKAAYVDDETLIWDHFINVRVNLNLPKKIILAEVSDLLDRYKKKYKFNTDKRLILSDANEVFQVWDLYQQAGKQPSRVTFKDTARITGRPLSTVKDQWCKAYEMIYGEKYNPNAKYATEKKRADATRLCAKCPYLTAKGAKCQTSGNDWHPCAEYLKITGKEKNEKLIEYRDQIDYDEYGKHSHKKKKYDE